jgi:hypothetical protein
VLWKSQRKLVMSQKCWFLQLKIESLAKNAPNNG